MSDLYTSPAPAPAELDDVHRLLPPEIFADIGIADDIDATTGAVRCSHSGVALVEGLAAHLAGVLGLTTCSRCQRHPPPTRAVAQHGCGAMVGGGAATVFGRNGGMACYAPAFGKNYAGPFDFEAMQQAQSFVPAVRHSGFRPRPLKHQGITGTGVFLPRAEAYQSRSASKPPGRPSLTRKDEAAAKPTTATATRNHALRPRGET